MNIPKFELELEKPSKKKCITTIIDNPNCFIYGNFCSIFDSVDVNKIEIPEGNVVCLEYSGISRGSYKKVYTGMIDSSGKKFITTDEGLFLDKCRGMGNECIQKELELVKREMLLQQEVYMRFPNLVPKIYAANIYEVEINQFEYNTYRLQMLMDDATDGGYNVLEKFLNTEDWNSKFNIDKGINNFMNGYKQITCGVVLNHKIIVTVKIISHMHKLLNEGKTIEFNSTYLDGNEKYVIPILSNLKKIHSMGIIHGDVKDDNVFVKDDEYVSGVRFIDFGMSRKRDELKAILKNKANDYKKSSLYKNADKEFRENLDIILKDIERDKTDIELEFYTYQEQIGQIVTLFLGVVFFRFPYFSVFRNVDFMFVSKGSSKFGEAPNFDLNKLFTTEYKEDVMSLNEVVKKYVQYILPIKTHIINYVKELYEKL